MSFKNFTSGLVHRLGLALAFVLFAVVISVAQDKTPASVYNDGLAALKAKNYESGLAMMEEAISLSTEGEDDKVINLAKKNGSIAAYSVAKAKKEAGSLDEALMYYEKGIELNPDNGSNYAGKASVLEEKGDVPGAVAAYIETGKMYADKPDRAEKMYKKAQIMVGKLYTGKTYDEAVAAGKSYLEKKDDNAEVHYYVSRSLLETGANEDALAHADKAIELAKSASDAALNDKYYYAKGLCQEALGQNADAITTYKMITGEKYKKQADYKIQKLGS